MTNNKEREFEEIMDKIFGTEPSRYSAWNKELFLQMFNEAYAKGRQSVLSKIPTGETIHVEMCGFINRQHKQGSMFCDEMGAGFQLGAEWALSKLSDDKGG